MFIFHYDSTDKYFLSHEYIGNDLSNTVHLPANSTDIAPPLNWEAGETPVYSEKNKKWIVVKDVFWKPSLKIETLKREFDFSEIPQLPEFDDLGKCKDNEGIVFTINCSIPKILNGSLFKMRFIQRLTGINIKIRNLYENDKKIKENNNLKTSELLEYKMQIEEVIHNLKKIIDDFVTAIYIQENIKDINENHQIRFDDIGILFSTQSDKYLEVLRQRINFNDNKDFLKVLKELHNGLKHEIFMAETDNLVGEKSPTVVLLKTNKGNLSDLTEYNLYLSQLILECKDFLLKNIAPID